MPIQRPIHDTEPSHRNVLRRATQEQLRHIITHAPIIVFALDHESVFTLSEGDGLRALGLTPGEMVGKTVQQVFSFLPEMAQHVEAALKGETVKVIIHDNGVALESSFLPMRDSQDEIIGVMGIAYDVTERETARAELRAALEREQELNAMKSRFLAVAAHELRSPLSVMTTSVHLFERHGFTMDAARAANNYDRMKAAIRRMTHFTDDILMLERANNPQAAPTVTRVDLRALTHHLVEELLLVDENAHEVLLDMPDTPVWVLGDKLMMRQMVVNLLSNALKYTPPGKPVRCVLTHEGRDVTLIVQDEGIGIPPEDLPHVFQPFHRARNVGQTGGSGLGLAIAERAIQLHGGRITVDSVPDKGTTFTVTLRGIGF
jgi:PAS domain S-box-containing protein